MKFYEWKKNNFKMKWNNGKWNYIRVKKKKLRKLRNFFFQHYLLLTILSPSIFISITRLKYILHSLVSSSKFGRFFNNELYYLIWVANSVSWQSRPCLRICLHVSLSTSKSMILEWRSLLALMHIIR